MDRFGKEKASKRHQTKKVSAPVGAETLFAFLLSGKDRPSGGRTRRKDRRGRSGHGVVLQGDGALLVGGIVFMDNALGSCLVNGFDRRAHFRGRLRLVVLSAGEVELFDSCSERRLDHTVLQVLRAVDQNALFG